MLGSYSRNFTVLHLSFGLKLLRHFQSQSELKQKPIVFGHTRFAALNVDFMYLLRVFISSLDCLCPL